MRTNRIDQLRILPPSAELKQYFIRYIMDKTTDEESAVIDKRLEEDDTLQPLYHEAVVEVLNDDKKFAVIRNAIATGKNEQTTLETPIDYRWLTEPLKKTRNWITAAMVFIAFGVGMLLPFFNNGTGEIAKNTTETVQTSNTKETADAAKTMVLLKGANSPQVPKGDGVKRSQFVKDIETIKKLIDKKQLSFASENSVSIVNFLILPNDDLSEEITNVPSIIPRDNTALKNFIDWKNENDPDEKDKKRKDSQQQFKKLLQYAAVKSENATSVNVADVAFVAFVGLAETTDLDTNYFQPVSYEFAFNAYSLALQIAPDNGDIKINLKKKIKDTAEKYAEILQSKQDGIKEAMKN